MRIKIGKINFKKTGGGNKKAEEKKASKEKQAKAKKPGILGKGPGFKAARLTIGKKIILGFLAVVAIFSLSTVYTYNTIISLNKGYDKLIKESTESVILAEGMKADALEKVLALNEFIVSGDKNDLEKVDECEASFNEGKYYLEKLLDTEETQKALKELSSANTEFNSMVEEIKALLENKEEAKVLELVNGKGAQVVENITLSADTIVRLEEGILDRGVEEQNAKGQSIVASLLLMTAVTIILSIVLSLYISRLISKPVARLSASAEKIAGGDLTAEGIAVKNKDEIGDLSLSFGKMLGSLKSMVERTMGSSAELSAAAQELMAGSEAASASSEEILASMQTVSQGIQNQKFSIDSISSAMEETSAEIQQIAANMQYVNNNAQTLNDLSDKGRSALEGVINQMGRISEGSKDSTNAVKALEVMSQKVQTIINMITEVSSQTNLLALNAAIEAARAGEQGRGFSVVADEVRKLAEKSSSAAKEISDTIETMNHQIAGIVGLIENEAAEVNEGTAVVSQANATFNDISQGVGGIITQVQEVSAAVQQITSGIEQVVASTGEILEAAENNSASIQEVSSAMEDQTSNMGRISDKAVALSELASALDTAVSVFRV